MMRMFSLLVLGMSLAWAPARALACTCLPKPIHRSSPKADAVDVALNQALALEGVFVPGSITLEDANGASVEFLLNEGPWPGCQGVSADVLPKAPLKPNTRYVLRVKPRYPDALSKSEAPDSISFTTGTKSLPDDQALAPPTGTASVLRNGPPTMCGGQTVFMCLGIDDPTDVELIIRRGDEILLRTTTLVLNDGLYATDQVPDCVELRRRSGTGRRSEPLEICGDALGIRAHRDSDSVQQVVQCRGGVIGREVEESPKVAPDAGRPIVSEPAPSTPDAGATSEDEPASERHARACSAGAMGAGSSYSIAWLWMVVLILRRTKPAKR